HHHVPRRRTRLALHDLLDHGGAARAYGAVGDSVHDRHTAVRDDPGPQLLGRAPRDTTHAIVDRRRARRIAQSDICHAAHDKCRSACVAAYCVSVLGALPSVGRGGVAGEGASVGRGAGGGTGGPLWESLTFFVTKNTMPPI